MQDPFTSEFEVVTTEGKKIQIYPMKLRHKDKICRFMEKFNSTFIFLNFMSPELDDEFTVKRDENGDVVFSNKEYEILKEVISMATRIPVEELDSEDGYDLDIADVRKIIETYLDVSQLKKKDQQQ